MCIKIHAYCIILLVSTFLSNHTDTTKTQHKYNNINKTTFCVSVISNMMIGSQPSIQHNFISCESIHINNIVQYDLYVSINIVYVILF